MSENIKHVEIREEGCKPLPLFQRDEVMRKLHYPSNVDATLLVDEVLRVQITMYRLGGGCERFTLGVPSREIIRKVVSKVGFHVLCPSSDGCMYLLVREAPDNSSVGR